MLHLQTNIPIPKDIPLPLPVPEWLLVTLLVVSFLLHIIFIQLMVGGTIITYWAQRKSLKDSKYDLFAHEIAKTITVNKSLAVVLGVAPLLSINALYTIYFYSANALTGFVWILIIPLVIIAFLLTYLHKWSWEKLSTNKQIHHFIILLALIIFLFIPLIFLTNVNLMMFPEKWGTIKGFLSALTLPNVFPRYLEFIGSTLTTTGLFIVWYNKRKNYAIDEIYNNQFNLNSLKRIGYSIALIGMFLQVIFGIIVMFTLPAKGFGFDVLFTMISIGSVIAIMGYLTYKNLIEKQLENDKRWKKIITLFFLSILMYGGSRQLYRQHALDPHRKLMAEKTEAFQKESAYARAHPKKEVLTTDPNLGEFGIGAAIFKKNCTSCHSEKVKLVGPPMTEMVSIYKNDSDGLKKWIKSPGKKRADFPQMPGFGNFSDQELNELAKFILSIKE